MILSDGEIRILCCNTIPHPMISPFSEAVSGGGVVSFGLSHAGYDLRLGDEIMMFKNTYNEVIDPKRFNDLEYRLRVFDIVKPSPYCQNNCTEKGSAYVIPPHSYILGYSLEYLRIPNFLKGHCVGKSTLARCGILINTTPLEPGWHGHLTIEISNITPCPAVVYAREGIAQLEFHRLSCTPETTYEGKKYQGQEAAAVPARIIE